MRKFRNAIAVAVLAALCSIPVIAHAKSNTASGCAKCDAIYEQQHQDALTHYFGCTAASQGNYYVWSGCMTQYYAMMGVAVASRNQCEQVMYWSGSGDMCFRRTPVTALIG